MDTYRTLYSLRVEHDYFDRLVCRSLVLRLTATGIDLCRRRGLLFRQTGLNEWVLLYDSSGAGVDTSSDCIETELCMVDPAFVLYTDWTALRPDNAYVLELPALSDAVEATEVIRESSEKRSIGSGFCTIRIVMTEKLFAAAQRGTPMTCTLRFRARQCKWEYLLISHNMSCLDSAQYLMEEQSGEITFTSFEKVNVYGKDALRTVSQEMIPMKEHYTCKLKVCLSAGETGRRQVLLKHVPFPVPGRFLDAEAGLLRQVCYF